MRRLRRLCYTPMVIVLILLMTPASALADIITTSPSTQFVPLNISLGASVSVAFNIQVQYWPDDTVSGCNAKPSSPVFVNLTVPSGISANSTRLVYYSCAAKYVTFTGHTAGLHTVGISVTGPGTLTVRSNLRLNVVEGIDPSAPVITKKVTGTLVNGWYTTNVGIDWTVSELESPASLTKTGCDAITISTDTTGTTLTCTATSQGGTSSDSVTVKRDTAYPTITPRVTPAPNQSTMWNNTDIVVDFDCSDATSGIAYCSAPVPVSTETSLTFITGTVTDNAGFTRTGQIAVHIDKTPPLVTGTPVTAPNASGWYTSSFQVRFDAADNLSSVWPKSKLVLFGTQGMNQSVSATFTDGAGNDGTGTVSGLNVDWTKPTISGSYAPTANSYGWINQEVRVTFECQDNVSLASCSPPIDLSRDGLGQWVSGTAVDSAGFSQEFRVGNINIDRTPPMISVQAFPPANEHGWRKTYVSLDFTASDALSGLLSSTPDQPFRQEGVDLSFTGSAEDKAGNIAQVTASGINIDVTRPEITGSASPAPNGYGWNNTDVTIRFSCTDSLSGVLSCSDPVLLTEQAPMLWAAGEASDKAGNTRSVTVSGVNIDKTPPIVYGAPAAPANTLGWYNQNITVNFTAQDQLSGLEGPVPPQVISTKGANLAGTGIARDKAGNEGSFTVRPLNLDKTPPTISASQSPAANSYGWNNSDVAVNFTCADSLSNILSCASPVVLTRHEAMQSASGSASDRAGNSTSTTLSGVNIDKIAPSISGAPAVESNQYGWYREDVTVEFFASDELSGLEATVPAQVISTEGSDLAVSGAAKDRAGNQASATVVGINLDRTAPTIASSRLPAPNLYGWNNTDVLVRFGCQDDLSKILSCSPRVRFTEEKQGQSVTGRASDRALNLASLDVTDVNIDKTPPTVTLTGPTLLLEGGVAEATALATDLLSGLAVDPTGKYALDTSTAGWHTISVSATDRAGNSASASLTYMVWGVDGPYAPLATRGARDAQFKAGASIPVRFELNDGTNIVGSATGAISIGSNSVEFRWSEGSKQYMATLQTPSTAGTLPVILSVTGAGSTIISTVTLR